MNKEHLRYLKQNNLNKFCLESAVNYFKPHVTAFKIKCIGTIYSDPISFYFDSLICDLHAHNNTAFYNEIDLSPQTKEILKARLRLLKKSFLA